jgi:hypothetical protein
MKCCTQRPQPICAACALFRQTIISLLSQRSALFQAAYSQLNLWQRDMAAAGLKHTGASMSNLTSALERLGAVDDCLQLAKLSEGARPGDNLAHRAALKVRRPLS